MCFSSQHEFQNYLELYMSDQELFFKKCGSHIFFLVGSLGCRHCCIRSKQKHVPASHTEMITKPVMPGNAFNENVLSGYCKSQIRYYKIHHFAWLRVVFTLPLCFNWFRVEAEFSCKFNKNRGFCTIQTFFLLSCPCIWPWQEFGVYDKFRTEQ